MVSRDVARRECRKSEEDSMSTSQGSSPIDNLTYDLVTALQNKL
jgi:hypothetical protein